MSIVDGTKLLEFGQDFLAEADERYEAKGSGGGGHIISTATATFPARTYLRFDGAEVTDNPTDDETVISIEGGGGIELDAPTNVSVINADEAVALTWTDPTDKIVDGVTLATWSGTLIVRKAGSAPTSKTDGVVVLDSKTRNAYSSTSFTDNNLTNGVTYYYGIFPYSTQKAYNYTYTTSITPSAIYPTAVSDLSVSGDNAQATVTWTQPADASSVNIVVSATGESDRTFTAATSPMTVTGLTNDTTYTVKAVSVNAKGRTTESAGVTVTPIFLRTMTINIDESNADPSTWATYADDAVNMTPGSDDWDEFFGIYPCILENGEEVGRLDPDDFSKYIDGTSAPISTIGKDVMIAFPRRDLSISKNGNVLTVSMTENIGKSGYQHNAHTYDSQNCDYFYIGAYQGYISGGKIYSTNNVNAQRNSSNTNNGYDTSTESERGAGYRNIQYYINVYLTCMFLLKYKASRYQSVMCGGTSSPTSSGSSALKTGTKNQSGMNDLYPGSSPAVREKLFGLEDIFDVCFLGSYYTLNQKMYYKTDPKSASYSEYNLGTAEIRTSERLKKVVGNNETPFIGTDWNGSNTTYYCYGGYIIADSNSRYARTNIFPLYCVAMGNYSSHYSYARLMYYHKQVS